MPTLLEEGSIVQGLKGDKLDTLKSIKAIDYIIDKFKVTLKSKSNKIFIIEAKTASGKSTVIPPYIYKTFNLNVEGMNKNIAVTQPRRLTAQQISEDIVNWNDFLKYGENVGFQTGILEKRPVKGINYMTIGTLYQQLLTLTDDEIMRKYSFIMIDEAHERDVNLDLSLYLLKQLHKRNYKNDDCPIIIITSATLEVDKYASYFETKNVIRVGGFNYDIEENYLQYDTDNYIIKIADLVENIVQESGVDKEDILVFLQGAGAINKLIKEVESRQLKKLQTIRLDSLSYRQTQSDYKNLVSKYDGQKLIIATNIAETGVTIDTLKYVIDSGWVYQNQFFPQENTNALILSPVTYGEMMQRRGRVGRKFAGHWYTIYTKVNADKFQKDKLPKLHQEDISESLLGIIRLLSMNEEQKIELKKDLHKFKFPFLKKSDLQKLDLLDPISCDLFEYCINKLMILDFINVSDNKIQLTSLGYIASQIRKLKLESRRMIFEGFNQKTNIQDLVTIATFMENDRLISSFDSIKKLYPNEVECDFIPYIYIFKEAIKLVTTKGASALEKWCTDYGLDYKVLMYAIDERFQIIKTIKETFFKHLISDNYISIYDSNKYKMTKEEFQTEVNKIKKCLYAGFKYNLVIRVEDNFYLARTGIRIKIKSQKNATLLLVNSPMAMSQNNIYVITAQQCCNVDVALLNSNIEV